MHGLSAEIVKNIVLAGAGNVELVDDEPVVAADLGANFFLTKDDIGKPVRAIYHKLERANSLCSELKQFFRAYINSILS